MEATETLDEIIARIYKEQGYLVINCRNEYKPGDFVPCDLTMDAERAHCRVKVLAVATREEFDRQNRLVAEAQRYNWENGPMGAYFYRVGDVD